MIPFVGYLFNCDNTNYLEVFSMVCRKEYVPIKYINDVKYTVHVLIASVFFRCYLGNL